jgi:hypothetical protein
MNYEQLNQLEPGGFKFLSADVEYTVKPLSCVIINLELAHSA